MSLARSSPAQAISTLIRGTASERGSVRGAIRLVNWSWVTVVASIGLCVVGVHAIDVAENLRPAGDLSSTAWKQVVFVIVGMLAAVFAALPHYKVIGLFAWPMLLGCLGLLVFLLVPFVPSWLVTPRNGARGWINFGPMDFQPSEVTKIAYVLSVAMYMRYRSHHRKFRGLIIPGLITAVPVGLITLQPDLGTACLFAPSLFAMLIAAGARKRHLVLIVVCAALAAPAAYPFLKPHQKERIVGLVKQIEGDRTTADDINYQSFTAQMLIGSGEATGAGSSGSRALVHYNRLPESHNDMVFAVIVARFGFVGGVGVLGLYVAWIGGALLTSATCRDPLGRLICVGLAGFVAAQTVVNVGMNIGLLPIIGITLPFVSYGGSSLLTCWLMTGLIAGVGLHRPRPPFRESFDYADGGDPDEARIPGGFRNAGFGGRALTR